MRICIFEDEYYTRLLPLSFMRPVYDLRCGQLTLREKIARVYPDEIFILMAREYLRNVVKERHPGSFVNEFPADTDRLLLINGRILYSGEVARLFADRGKDVVFVRGDLAVGAWLSGENLNEFRKRISSGVLSRDSLTQIDKVELPEVELINYPWDLVRGNGEQLFSDFQLAAIGKPGMQGKVYEGAHLLNPDSIHIGKASKIKPGAVLDAENGPVYVARNVEVMPNAVIRGPAFIGEGSVIKAGAKIYENTSIGESCKVGGEVAGSIIHGHSNKQHEGFLGHSYLGEWVNIGAGASTSDLKNDYGNVKVYNSGIMMDTGLQHAGLTMGDHSKCGINFSFNTGTVVGVFCNLFGTSIPPRYVPSFSWGEQPEKFVTYRLEKAAAVARTVMKRRDVDLSPAEEDLIKRVFELTVEDRDTGGVKN